MSVAVSENIREEFSKPPPKKKWLQNYIGQDNNSTQQLTLSKDVIGGVVQGVIDQFSNYLDHDTKEEPKVSSPAEEEKLSQTDIAPVVQSVISQFLNGSLADSGFRRSRKRSHKNINSRSKDKSGSSYSSSASSIRKASVIQYKGLHSEKSDKPSIKVRKLEALISTESQTKQMFSNQLKHPSISKEVESTEALNLSCPKINTKVTFANEDRCYSIDSVKSFQESKSLKMRSLDYYRIHENLQLIVAEDEPPLIEEEAPLNLVSNEKKCTLIEAPSIQPFTPVIRLRESIISNQSIYSPISKNQNEFSLSNGRLPPKPLELITLPETKKQRNVFPVDRKFSPTEINPVTLSRLKPMRPTDCSSSSQVLQDLISARPLKTNNAIKTSPSSSPSNVPEPTCSFTEPESRTGPKQSTREVHNRLEKNRRAHLKSCFNELAFECDLDPAKASNLLVIRTAYKSIMALRREEREQERALANLVQDKISRQARLNELRREFAGLCPEPDSD